MLTEKETNNKRPVQTTPYTFNSVVSAQAAESAVNQKFPEIHAYTSSKILFVPNVKSMVLAFAIEDFIKSLGGKESSVY